MIVLTATVAALYAALRIPFLILQIVPGIADLRPAAAVPMVCSLLFGPAAAWGAGFGNLIGDFFTGEFGIGSAFGFLGNFMLGYLPYKVWAAFRRKPPLPKSPVDWAVFVLAAILASASCALVISWGMGLLGLAPPKVVAPIILFNNTGVCAILGGALVFLLHDRIRILGLLYVQIMRVDRSRFNPALALGVVVVVAATLAGLDLTMRSPVEAARLAAAAAPITPFVIISFAAIVIMSDTSLLRVVKRPAELPGTPARDHAIAVRNVSFKYERSGAQVLAALFYRQKEREFVVIMGRTGAGKSTFVRLLNGIIPDFYGGTFEGEVMIFGRDTKTTTPPELSIDVGVVFQDFETQLFSTNATLEVAFALENHGVPRWEIESRIEDALDMVGLTGFEERSPSTLCGGEKQRLAIASVLATRPRIIVLDEPTTDLDPAGKDAVMKIAAGLEDFGMTTVLVEHSVEAARTADRVVIMDDGRIVSDGPPQEVLADAEALRSHGVRPSALTEIFTALGLPERPFTVHEAAELLRKHGVAFKQAAPPPEPGRSADAAISVADLHYTYKNGVHALRGVSLEIAKGEFVAILGRNGSGKTTLVKHFNGLLRPADSDGGRVFIHGEDIAGKSVAQLGRIVGYVFQNPDDQIFAPTVMDEVAFAPRNAGLPEDEVKERVAEALAAVRLEGSEQSDPFSMTKGERQRIAVASVLASRPDIIILDEPTTGLDYGEQKKMMDLVRRLNDDGHTVIIVTHAMWAAAEYARRIVIMNDGEIISDGPARDVIGRRDVMEQASLTAPEVVQLSNEFSFTALSVEEFLGRVEGGSH